MWFNTRARVPISQTLQFEYAQMVSTKIKEIIAGEARKLQMEWYKGIPEYFNRRAYGMYFSKKGYPHGRRPTSYRRQSGRFRRKRGVLPNGMGGPFIGGPNSKYLYNSRGTAIGKDKIKGRRQFPGRTHTGQLRRALSVVDMSVLGCELYVKPCYSSTGGKVDYVAILMKGSMGKSDHPYIPELDRRIYMPGRKWGGVKQSYWIRWQHYFDKRVEMANKRLHDRISKLILDMKIMEQTDISRVMAGSKKKLNITRAEEERRSRKKVSGPIVPNSPYDEKRDFMDYGNIKRDPQVYINKYGKFNPFKEFSKPKKSRFN